MRGAWPRIACGLRPNAQFSGFAANAALAPEAFRFVVPAGADVLEQ